MTSVIIGSVTVWILLPNLMIETTLAAYLSKYPTKFSGSLSRSYKTTLFHHSASAGSFELAAIQLPCESISGEYGIVPHTS
jgi:hypothetical protein